MARITKIIKDHLILAALAGAILPLIVLVALQYRSLREIEQTKPASKIHRARQYLFQVSQKVADFYDQKSKALLDLDPYYLTRKHPGKLTDPKEYSTAHLQPIAENFRDKNIEGIRRLFVGFVAEAGGQKWRFIFFYNPLTQAMDRELYSNDWTAAHGAASVWLSLAMLDRKADAPPAALEMSDLGPDTKVVIRPILDAASKVVGVTGFFVSETQFRETVSSIISEQPESPDTATEEQMVVTLRDGQGDLLFSSRQVEDRGEEVSVPLPVLFRTWTLGMRYVPEIESWARSSFSLNFSLTVLMTLLLAIGIMTALRLAAREMKLSQIKADFVANVSHELRTPITSIKLYGEMLQAGEVADAQKIRQYGAKIGAEGQRLSDLIESILDFSRLESGVKDYHYKKVNVVKLVGDTIERFEKRPGGPRCCIVLETPAGTERHVWADPVAISQVVFNLLDNAVKYSPAPAQVSVTVDSRGRHIVIAVSDAGMGMPTDELGRIFQKFYRIHTSYAQRVAGTGLGLSIVKQIVEAHKGEVVVSSAPGTGSTFIVSLPSLESPSSNNRRNTRSPLRKGAGSGRPGGMADDLSL